MKAGSLLVSSGIFIKNIYESDSYFFILYNGSEPQELIWNKTTHQGILVELNDNFRGHTYAPMAVSALAVLNDDEKYYDPNNGNRYLPVSRQKQTLQFRPHANHYPSGLLSLTVCHPATVRDKDLLYTTTGKTYRKSNISSRNSLPAALSA